MKLKFIQIALLLLMTGCSQKQRIAKLTSDADAFNKEENYNEAVKDYSEVIRLDPQFGPAYVARGGDFVMLGRYDEAIKDLSAGLRLNPTNYVAYQLRGTAFLGKRQYDKAISDLNSALENQSDDTNTANAFNIKGESYKLRGMAYYRIQSYTNAIAEFTAASNYLPTDYSVYEWRGRCYTLTTDADKALNDFNKATQLNSEDALAFYLRGRIYSKTGPYTNAIKDFEKVILLTPKLPFAYNLLAWLLATCPDDSIRNGKKAIELANQACNMTQWTNYAYVDTLAAAYAESGDFEQAVKYQKKASNMGEIPEDNRTNVENRVQLYLQYKPYRTSKLFKTSN